MTSKADLKRMMIRLVTSLLCVSFWACGTESQTSGPGFRNVDAFPLERLSQYDFFEGAMSKLTPTSGVVPYQVTSPLWADHAGKARFIYCPKAKRSHQMLYQPGLSRGHDSHQELLLQHRSQSLSTGYAHRNPSHDQRNK